MQRLAPSFPLRAAQALSGLPAAKRPALWLADRLADAAATAAVRPSGFAALDAELPGGGWPASGLTELLFSAPGSGELRLLAPLLAQGPQEGLHADRLLCVAPPFLPYAPALQALAWPLERLLLVQPASLADAAWAAEQALRSGACSAVLWWQADERTSAAALTTALRRLHLAAQDSQCPLFALRPASARAQSSPAPLRLLLEPAAQGQWAVSVFKRRGPAMVAPLQLTLPLAGLPARRALRRVLTAALPPAPAVPVLSEAADAVAGIASERIAA